MYNIIKQKKEGLTNEIHHQGKRQGSIHGRFPVQGHQEGLHQCSRAY